MWTLFFLNLIPLILFSILNYYKGIKAGVLSGITASIILLLYFWLYLKIIDQDILIMTLLLVILGFLSIQYNNTLYFKLQPVLSAIIVIAIIFWLQVIKGLSIFTLFTEHLKDILPAKDFALLKEPSSQQILQRMPYHAILWTSLHTLILTWTALYCRTSLWLLIKALFLPFLLIMIILSELILQSM